MTHLAFSDLLDEMDLVDGLADTTVRDIATAYAPGCALSHWNDICLYVDVHEPRWSAEIEQAIRSNLQGQGFRLMVVYETR